LETILTIPSELEYLEGLVKLTRKHKDEKVQHVAQVVIAPRCKQDKVNNLITLSKLEQIDLK
jgi:hypothetical protein